jgi:haloacetate dehalogenase
MFQGFQLEMVELPEATLRVRHGGSGPPLLLLHGHPAPTRRGTRLHRCSPRLSQWCALI